MLPHGASMRVKSVICSTAHTCFMLVSICVMLPKNKIVCDGGRGITHKIQRSPGSVSG